MPVKEALAHRNDAENRAFSGGIYSHHNHFDEKTAKVKF